VSARAPVGEIAKGSDAEINVIALIGERGGEVKPFVEDCLAPACQVGGGGCKRANEPAAHARRAAQTALAIADSYRQRGRHVLSWPIALTRLAGGAAAISIANGEPPSSRSFHAVVLQLLANYVECMGNSDHGSITGILTVLVDRRRLRRPITDAVRSFVDATSSSTARSRRRVHFPAISIGPERERVLQDVADGPHQSRHASSRDSRHYAQAEDLIRIAPM